jgi:adenylate kinase
MRLVLVGPPGAGKGTQAQFLAAHYSIPHISTGDIFRANLKSGTELGIQAKGFMDRGELVPDSVTNDMVRDRLTHDDVANGFILDGFPRNVAQAEVLRAILADKKTPLHAVLEFSLADEEIIARLLQRAEIENREDDKEEVIKRRLEVYAEQTAPIISFYRNEGLLVSVSAVGNIEDITAHAISALSRVAQ